VVKSRDKLDFDNQAPTTLRQHSMPSNLNLKQLNSIR